MEFTIILIIAIISAIILASQLASLGHPGKMFATIFIPWTFIVCIAIVLNFSDAVAWLGFSFPAIVLVLGIAFSAIYTRRIEKIEE
jgi:hypothetical protein